MNPIRRRVSRGRIACAGLVVLAAGGGTPWAAPAAAPPPSSGPPSSGTIEGVVSIEERPQRRVVNRYVGSGDPGARRLQDVPVVAYVEGAVTGAPAPAPVRIEIAQRDTAFSPPVRVVPVGTTLEFPNHDPFFHNVVSFSPAKRFDLGRYATGESKSVLFDQPGAVKVYCEVHEYMRAAVIVVDNPFHAVVDADGRFTISGVPAGTYRLVIWHVELRPQELEVTVPEGGVVGVEATLS